MDNRLLCGSLYSWRSPGENDPIPGFHHSLCAIPDGCARPICPPALRTSDEQKSVPVFCLPAPVLPDLSGETALHSLTAVTQRNLGGLLRHDIGSGRENPSSLSLSPWEGSHTFPRTLPPRPCRGERLAPDWQPAPTCDPLPLYGFSSTRLSTPRTGHSTSDNVILRQPQRFPG